MGDNDRMVRIQLLQSGICTRQTSCGNDGGSVWVRRFINTLPGAEGRVILQAIDNPHEQLLCRRIRRGWQVAGCFGQSWPTKEMVGTRVIHPNALLRDLLVNLRKAPVAPATANEVRTRASDFSPRVAATRR